MSRKVAMGRDRSTLYTYAREADAFGRVDEAADLRQHADLHERLEKIGLGKWMGEPRTSLDATMQEVVDAGFDGCVTTAQQALLSRAVQDWSQSAVGIVNEFGCFMKMVWPKSSPLEPFDPLGPRVCDMDGSMEQKMMDINGKVMGFVIIPLPRDGTKIEVLLVDVIGRICK